jgi:Ca2+-binding EF-hand superfamily protein
MKLPPSGENLVDGDERGVLGLVWAMLLKFMKLQGEEEAGGNLKDALLLWVQNKTQGYAGVNVIDFKSSIRDGVALGAIIHKHRPNMIDMSKLKPGKEHATANWNVVQDAALRYFDLEKYITPDEILKLDENSCVVYVSEYYYGIAEQRKLDLAARRIAKVIRFTKENDALRDKYVAHARSFVDRVAKVRVLLGDRTIDNTMAGARSRIDQFYAYKATDKSAILSDQLALEGLFNSLAMRLSHGKRPAYVPPAGTDLAAMNATIAELEKSEQERKVALHKELNRQLQLVDFDKQHAEQAEKLAAYQAATARYLEHKEVSHSIGAASYQLRRLDASDKERADIEATTFAKIVALGNTLQHEKYENLERVRARETAAVARFGELSTKSAAKRPILDDDLAREIFREGVRLQVEEHIGKFEKLTKNYGVDAKAYLETKEHVDSVADATNQLGLLTAYAAEKELMTTSAVATLNALGDEILRAHFKGLSEYRLGDAPDVHKPADVTQRRDEVAALWAALDALHARKLAVLNDDFARETFRRDLVLKNQTHVAMFAKIEQWVAAQSAYLERKEHVDSVEQAQTALAVLQASEEDKAVQTGVGVKHLHDTGASIKAAKYSGLTEYTFGSAATDTAFPRDIDARHAAVDAHWAALSALHAKKLEVLSDDLARETFRADLMRKNETHIKQFTAIQAWHAAQSAYLGKREAIDSVDDAQTALSILGAYVEDKQRQTDSAVAHLRATGAAICAAKYAGLTTYTFGSAATDKAKPADIEQRQAEVGSMWAALDQLYAAKHELLQDDLARELFRANLRTRDNIHRRSHAGLVAFSDESSAYLQRRELIDDVPKANTAIAILGAFRRDKASTTETAVAALNHLGAEIMAAKYASAHSSYTFGSAASDTQTPAQLQEREASIVKHFAALDALAGIKQAWLDKELDREQKKEEKRVEFANAAASFARFALESGNEADATHFGFTLAEVEASDATLHADDAARTAAADAQRAAAVVIFDAGAALGVQDNAYTSATPATLVATQAQLSAKLAARRERFVVELARQRHLDQLCRQFAALADPFSAALVAAKDAISAATSTLAQQLEFVAGKIAEAAGADKTRLAEIAASQKKLDDEGVVNNIHTTITSKDLQTQHDQYVLFLQTKKTQLEQAIEQEKLRGLTAEQLEEIKEAFVQFDSDHNQSINLKELKSALYSLGEEKGSQSIKEIMDKYGKNNEMQYDGFKEFMIGLLGDTDGPDEITSSFRLINKGDESVAHDDRMRNVMMPADVDYVQSTAPAKAPGVDYKSWVGAIFSR